MFFLKKLKIIKKITNLIFFLKEIHFLKAFKTKNTTISIGSNQLIYFAIRTNPVMIVP